MSLVYPTDKIYLFIHNKVIKLNDNITAVKDNLFTYDSFQAAYHSMQIDRFVAEGWKIALTLN